MTLVLAFGGILRKYADKTAVEFYDEAVSFSDLDKESNKVANALVQKGVQKGDRVALFLGTCLELVYFFLGILKAGAIVVPVNTAFKEQEAAYLLSDSGSKIVVTDADRLPILKNIQSKLSELKHIVVVDNEQETPYKEFISKAEDTEANVQVTDADGSIIFYTSGTTGQSKGALLSHKNMESNIDALKEAWHMDNRDKLLLVLPLHHIHGLGVALASCFYNGFSIVLRKKYNADETVRLFKEKNCTLFMGVPTMYVNLLEVEHDIDFSTMRLFVSGSAPLSAETFREFRERYGVEILERAGMSETNMNFSNPYEGKRKPGTVGLPLKGVQVKIADKDFNEVKQGQEGSILLKGPNVFSGYWNDPEKTRESFHDGWFITGDLGKIDEDGYIVFLGRSKDLIISGGINIYPTEVEEVINTHPAVLESAIIGVPDKYFGEAGKAFVVLKNNKQISETEIIEYCKEKLASFKKPKYVEFLPELPRNSMGKVQKTVLREREAKHKS